MTEDPETVGVGYCRFPKSCSATVYNYDIADELLEPLKEEAEPEIDPDSKGYWCGGCGHSIATTDPCGYHYRLQTYFHGTDDCMSNVYGEDIRGHCVRLMPDGPIPTSEFLEALKEPEDQICTGCGSPSLKCGPKLWRQQKKCCPDCSHTAAWYEAFEEQEGEENVEFHDDCRRVFNAGTGGWTNERVGLHDACHRDSQPEKTPRSWSEAISQGIRNKDAEPWAGTELNQ